MQKIAGGILITPTQLIHSNSGTASYTVILIDNGVTEVILSTYTA